MLVGFCYADPCPYTNGLIASTNATCECETATSSGPTCSAGEYCAVQGNEARCLDNPLCTPNDTNIEPECFCGFGSEVTCNNFCLVGEVCSEHKRCNISDILTEPCVYGDNVVCDIGSEFSNVLGCVEQTSPPVCSADLTDEQECVLPDNGCNENRTICNDEYGQPNGCGEMPVEFLGDADALKCKSGATCDNGICTNCPSSLLTFSSACSCDCAAYYSGWLGERQCSELKETYKEAYNICECNTC